MTFSYGYTQNPNCPSPDASITIINPCRPDKSIVIPAIVDSGAMKTCIPESKIQKLGYLSYSSCTAVDFNGNSSERRIYNVNIRLENETFEKIDVIAINKNYALIGRDILNQKRIMLDAKQEIWIYNCSVHCPPSHD